MRTTRERARRLRRNQTDAEAQLWYFLRRRQLAGARFRRQHPIGPFIADFGCPAHHLVIELDGGQHDPEREQRDARTKFLRARGYHVLRFWNHEVLEAPELVIDIILVNLQGTPPQPSPAAQGRG